MLRPSSGSVMSGCMELDGCHDNSRIGHSGIEWPDNPV
jgi:hypothetical protein